MAPGGLSGKGALMRLRVRSFDGSTTTKVDVPAQFTLNDLQNKVAPIESIAQGCPAETLTFSLNKKV